MPGPRISIPLSEEDHTVISRRPDAITVMGANHPYLHIIHPRDKSNRYPISREGLVLGRGTKVDVFLKDAQVSREHCRIRSTPAGITIEDLGSTNGTQVDGEMISRCVLHPAGRLKVGGFVMRVEYRAQVEIKEEEQLKQAAQTDELTGLPNRRLFFQEAATVLQDAIRSNALLSMVMIDIDHFKRVNDRFGHAAGDHVIQQVASTLAQEKRSSDLVARFGGEEFVMLLPNTSQSDALFFCDRLCEKIAQLALHFDGDYIQTQVSIGIVTKTAGEIHSIDKAISAADEAMYRAKNNGRNQVSM